MPLDGIAAQYLAEELHDRLAGGRVDRIHQTGQHDLVLAIRSQGENHRLLISARHDSPRMHLTSQRDENPSYPPMFCMLLRKHLIGTRLTSVHCVPWERIFTLQFEGTDELSDRKIRRLIVEIMGRHSNVILVDDQNRILDAAAHVSRQMSRARQVLPGMQYSPPPDQNKLTPRQLLQRVQEDPNGRFLWVSPKKNVVLTLLDHCRGMSPPLCREICFRADVDGQRTSESLSGAEQLLLASALSGFLQELLNGSPAPYIYKKYMEDRVPSDFHIVAMRSAGVREARPTLSAAMDEFFLSRVSRNRFQQKQKSLMQQVSAALQRALRKMDAHQSDLHKCDNADSLRKQGEWILAGMHELQEGIPGFYAVDYESETQERHWVRLDPSRSLSGNAQALFRQYAKAKSRLAHATRLLEEDRASVSYLSTLQNALENAESEEDLDAVAQEWTAYRSEGKPSAEQESGPRRKKKPGKASAGKKKPRESRPRHFMTSDGLIMLVGRNNLQNDRLTLKTADPDDLWFHVQKQPGTHVILRVRDQTVPEQSLLEAARTAAWFSRPGNRQMLPGGAAGGAIAVDYCPVRNVRKPNGARPGMVIYDQYRTVMVEPKDPASLRVPEESGL